MSVFRCSQCGQINRIREPQDGSRTPRCGKCKAALDTSGAPQDVDSKSLSSAIRNSPVPVLVDLWAPWCGPCRMVAPVLDAVGRERKGELMVLKLNSDDNPDVSAKLQIRGIPTMLLYKGGKEHARQAGAMSKPQLGSWLDSHI